MVNRVLMWAAASPRLQRQVTENPIARRAARRAQLPANRRHPRPPRGGVTDLSGASHAVAEYVPPTDYRYPHMGG